MKNRKPEPSHIRGMCVICNNNKQKKYAGKDKYRAICSGCDKRLYQKSFYNYPKSYRKYKKLSCERCGFIPEDPCQLDVDHIDGNSSNHDISNLQTLCSNCHRLKTKLNNDGPYKKKKLSEVSSSESFTILEPP